MGEDPTKDSLFVNLKPHTHDPAAYTIIGAKKKYSKNSHQHVKNICDKGFQNI